MIIAGHDFIETIHGRACRSCGKRYVDISTVEFADIGKPNIAYHGNLYLTEYEQIVRENQRMWGHVVGVAAGGAVADMPRASVEAEQDVVEW
jgi:hypothetical protein